MKLNVFLLAGAIINVAVAWGLALWMHFDSHQRKAIAVGDLTSIDPQALNAALVTSTAFGVRQHSTLYMRRLIGHDKMPRETRSIMPPGIYPSLLVDAHAGWPMLSLQSNLRITYALDNPHPQVAAKRGMLLYRGSFDVIQSFNSLDQSKMLSYAPVWPGFAINTIFYAASLWIMITLPGVPGAVRRRVRIKRGLCASCGYSLRDITSQKCPECGRSTPSPFGRGRGEGEMQTR